MVSQHRKHRGYKTQRLVADYLKNWWPYALSQGAGSQGSDVTGVPFDVEVKATRSWSPKTWLDQSKARTAKSGALGFCVIRLTGQGEGSVGDYAALLPLSALVELLSLKYGHIGYEPKESDIIRCKSCGGWVFQQTICKNCEAL